MRAVNSKAPNSVVSNRENETYIIYNTYIDKNTEADLNAIRIYVRMGYYETDAKKAFEKIFNNKKFTF